MFFPLSGKLTDNREKLLEEVEDMRQKIRDMEEGGPKAGEKVMATSPQKATTLPVGLAPRIVLILADDGDFKARRSFVAVLIDADADDYVVRSQWILEQGPH